jgi:hypothetical protein
MEQIFRQNKLKMIGKIFKSLTDPLFKFKIRLMTSNNFRTLQNTSKMLTLIMIRMDSNSNSNIRIGTMINTIITIPPIIMTD